MPTSVKRYGLEAEDLETELRLRRIEGELERLAGASSYGDVSVQTQRTDSVPRVSGLRVIGSTPGAVTVAWSQVRISNLRRYELEIAEDCGFSENRQQFNVAGTEWQFSTISATGGGGDTDVFARVRAQNKSGTTGEWSAVLNTETGQAQSDDIADEAITDPKLDDSAVIQLALRGYKSGFTLSINDDNPLTEIDFSTGVARDAGNVMSIDWREVITKSLSAYQAGSGNGGMSADGGLTADTWYWAFVVSDGTSATVDAGFDDSLTAVNLLADSGLSFYRRVGAIKTNGSSQILAFHQLGDDFIWDVPVDDIEVRNPGTGEVIHTLTAVPTGIDVLANVTFSFNTSHDSGNSYAYCGGYASLPAVGDSYGDIHPFGKQRGGSVHDKVLTNTLAQVKTRQKTSSSNYYVRIQVHGWVDTLGRDGEA